VPRSEPTMGVVRDRVGVRTKPCKSKCGVVTCHISPFRPIQLKSPPASRYQVNGVQKTLIALLARCTRVLHTAQQPRVFVQ